MLDWWSKYFASIETLMEVCREFRVLLCLLNNVIQRLNHRIYLPVCDAR